MKDIVFKWQKNKNKMMIIKIKSHKNYYYFLLNIESLFYQRIFQIMKNE